MADSRPPVAWPVVLPPAAVTALVLTLGSAGYGYHRDELYFRMLPPAWGYTDQPPLAPFLARASSAVVDEVWALRVPATLACAVSVVLLALVARELGGGRVAQGVTAWGYGLGIFPLLLGHVLLTSTIDLALLLGVVLLVLRAVGGSPRAWVWAGLLVGAATWNRWLVVVLTGGLVLGLLALGPRATLRTPWPWVGAGLAALVAAPMVAYQVANGWPQLAMGAALAEDNADDVRATLPLVLLVLVGPPMLLVWLRGWWWLVQPGQRRRFGFLAVALVVLLVFTAVTAAQPHYPVHLVPVAWAAGCVAWERAMTATRPRRVATVALVGLNATVALVTALPVVPLGAVGATPVPGMNPLVGDQVGWRAYVGQVADAYDAAAAAAGSRDAVAVFTSNYGEAGAVARFGAARGLPAPYSGQNALHDLGPPPEGTRVLVVVGGQLEVVRPLFAGCEVVDRLDNGVGVDNEEQGQPVAVCRDPLTTWGELWPRLRHLD